MDVIDPASIPPNKEGREMYETESGDAKEEYLECFVSVLKIGLSCSKLAPRDRTPIGRAGPEPRPGVRTRLGLRIKRGPKKI